MPTPTKGPRLGGGPARQAIRQIDGTMKAVDLCAVATVLEGERIVAVQRQAMRWTYLGSGMSHPSFLGALNQIAPARAAWLAEAALAFV